MLHQGQAWIREGKNAVKWTKLSCHDFMDNHVRFRGQDWSRHLEFDHSPRLDSLKCQELTPFAPQ